MLTSTQRKQIKNFISEGKKISEIRRENFPESSYAEIYSAAHDGTDGSSLGIKKKITYRLNKLVAANSKIQKDEFATDIRDLVNSLYRQHKDMSAKLAEIRDVLE